MTKNIWNKLFVGTIIILLALPLVPSFIAHVLVFPFFDCDAPMHAGNVGNNELNDPVCGKWWSFSFGMGWLGLLTWPAAVILTFIFAIFSFYFKSKKR